jgi:hypothetical protein
MICIAISCQLGNQLFQYAFGYATSKKLNTFLVIDRSNKFHGYMLNRYFLLHKSNRVRHTLWTLYYTYLKKTQRIYFLQQNGWNHPERIMDRLADNTEYKGFYQSAAYFSKYHDDICRLFTIRNKFVKAFHQKYQSLLTSRKTIVVHIRRTDYMKAGDKTLGGTNVCLPDAYIVNCLNKIDDITSYHLIFISDDIGYVKATFSSKYPLARFEHNPMIIDFQLLMHADILIVSNSTFAWWGAYLNPKKDKIIYAPQYWLGFKVEKEYPVSIIPRSWITVPVTAEYQLCQGSKM